LNLVRIFAALQLHLKDIDKDKTNIIVKRHTRKTRIK